MSKETALAAITGAPVVTPPAAPATPTVDSDRFAKLAASEQKIVKDREALKAERAKYDEDIAKLKPVQEQLTQFEELKKTDKIAALKLMGFTEEDIFNFLSNKEEPKELTPAEIAAQAAREEIEKDRALRKEEQDKLANENNEKAIKAYREEISKSVQADVDKYEYCAHYGAVAEEIIYDTILEFMQDDATLTPVDAMKEAMEAVENMYENQYKALSTLKKVKPKEVVVEEKKEPPKKQVGIPPRPALTKPPPPPAGRETPAQKRERLENLLRGGGRTG